MRGIELRKETYLNMMKLSKTRNTHRITLTGWRWWQCKHWAEFSAKFGAKFRNSDVMLTAVPIQWLLSQFTISCSIRRLYFWWFRMASNRGQNFHVVVSSCQLIILSCQLVVSSLQLVVSSCQLVLPSSQLVFSSCQLVVSSCRPLNSSYQLATASLQLVISSCQLVISSSRQPPF